MELFQICVKNIPVYQNRVVHTVNRSSLTGHTKKHFMAEAVYDFCILVSKKLSSDPLGAFTDIIALLQVIACLGSFAEHVVKTAFLA